MIDSTLNSGYYITRLAIGMQPKIPITKDQYDALSAADRGLRVIFQLEQAFDLLVENYIEFRSSSVSLVVRRTITREETDKSWLVDYSLLNRRLVNFLTTAKLYAEHVPRHMKSLLGRKGCDAFRGQIEECRGSSEAFKILEALRDYAQHRDLPIADMSIQQKYGGAPAWRIELSVHHLLDPKELLADRKFKEKAGDALTKKNSDVGEQIKLDPMLREYVSLLGKTHDWVRESTREKFGEWSAMLNDALDLARQQWDGDLSAVGIAQEGDDETFIQSISLADLWVQSISELRKKNRDFESLPHRHITTG